MYLILCWSYLNHSLRFVGEKKRRKKKSHIKSQSQYFGKKSQLDYFPKSFSPTGWVCVCVWFWCVSVCVFVSGLALAMSIRSEVSAAVAAGGNGHLCQGVCM